MRTRIVGRKNSTTAMTAMRRLKTAVPVEFRNLGRVR